MADPLNASREGVPSMPLSQFQTTMWVLCGTSALFLASRFAVRMSTKGRLMVNDYFLVVSLPALLIGAGVLHSALGSLYAGVQPSSNEPLREAPRLTAAIELLWITIYSVKFCFLAQFKFHKPPYAYVSVHLTRHYWACVALTGAAFVFTIIQPIVSCPNSRDCQYFHASNVVIVALASAVTAVDIVTDLLVISIPVLLIYMANFTKSRTVLNCVFKSLSLFAIAIAVTRLRFQYDAESRQIQQVPMIFWLFVEAAVAVVMASISSYRTIVLDFLVEWRINRQALTAPLQTHVEWDRSQAPHRRLSFGLTKPDLRREDHSEIPLVRRPQDGT
ncbi:hypothetical protein EJ04DRAFT_552053 [Polyplosphaeria fusca]|uniref:Rhodopsin domain-containing protein n=1 Tax=Polyplosphaeria fusca TaxID=682080 RepID=A0A9P4V4E5_9PLEO|nr:hypothetical protein EJ04DRAFT_552053 [Polyplosphaeria fusca]